MILAPDGWTVRRRVGGRTLIAPEGAAAGLIRYVERVYPLRRVRDLVPARVAAYADLIEPRAGDIELLTTNEGEYAAVVPVQGTVAGAPACLCLGFVFGDDFYASIEGIAHAAGTLDRMCEVVRTLVVDDQHGLGMRRRRYVYAPPPSWQPLARGFVTDWIPPGFPNVWSVLTVHPTLSLASSAGIVPALLARAGASGFDIDLQAPVTTIRSDVGLVGASVETVGYQSGAPTHYAVAAFSDTRYVYCSELVSRSPESWATHRDAFSSVWRSIEPVPGPRTFEDISDSKPLLHWLD